MINTDHDGGKSLRETFGIFFAIGGAIIIPICIYISRSIFAETITFNSFWQIFSFFLCLVISILFTIVVATVYTLGWRFHWFVSGTTNVPRLLLAVFCTSLVAYFAPLLPTPQQSYFAQHKSEFEHQVELIKEGSSIDKFGNLSVGIDDNSKAIVFWYWSEERIYLSSYAYVYADKYSDLADVFMCNDEGGRRGAVGEIYATLATNWYLCYRTDEWN